MTKQTCYKYLLSHGLIKDSDLTDKEREYLKHMIHDDEVDETLYAKGD